MRHRETHIRVKNFLRFFLVRPFQFERNTLRMFKGETLYWKMTADTRKGNIGHPLVGEGYFPVTSLRFYGYTRMHNGSTYKLKGIQTVLTVVERSYLNCLMRLL